MERSNHVAFANSPSKLTEELALVRPTWFGTISRVLEKVHQAAHQKAEQAGHARVFELATEAAVAYSRERSAGSVSLLTRVRRALFDRLVYRKLRGVRGGSLLFCVCGGGPLPKRLGHFLHGSVCWCSRATV